MRLVVPVLGILVGVGCNHSSEGTPTEQAVEPHPETKVIGEDQGSPTVAEETALAQRPVGPEVALDGQARLSSVAAVDSGARVYARRLRAWIHEKPDGGTRRLGYLRAGASVPVAGTDIHGPGCKGEWRGLKQGGYVCLGRSATLDAEDPGFRAFEQYPPRTDQRLPYRYGTVRKRGPVFTRVPTESELQQSEPDFNSRYPLWLESGGEIGASFRQEVWEWGEPVLDPKMAWSERLTRSVPDVLKTGTRLSSPTGVPRPSGVVLERMKRKVGYAMLDTFFSDGRRYGLSTHLEVVPTDRLRPILGSDFHGAQIGKDIDLPFVFVRRVGGRFTDGTRAEYRTRLRMTGKKKKFGGRMAYEVDGGKYIDERYASEVRLARKMPGWAKKGQKWIDISINRQLLMLYEGEKMVYATLISSGEAGLASSEETTATKRGIFRIHTKHLTTTMSSDEIGEEFELRDVPYVQYFADGGFALHGAYWHDRFGTPKSHGCINLAPEDARRIFFWTDPPLPTGWHGALSPLKGTVVFVHP